MDQLVGSFSRLVVEVEDTPITIQNGVDRDLLAAAMCDDIDAIKAMFETRGTTICINKQDDEDGNTILHHVARRDTATSLEIWQFLLARGADARIRNRANKSPADLTAPSMHTMRNALYPYSPYCSRQHPTSLSDDQTGSGSSVFEDRNSIAAGLLSHDGGELTPAAATAIATEVHTSAERDRIQTRARASMYGSGILLAVHNCYGATKARMANFRNEFLEHILSEFRPHIMLCSEPRRTAEHLQRCVPTPYVVKVGNVHSAIIYDQGYWEEIALTLPPDDFPLAEHIYCANLASKATHERAIFVAVHLPTKTGGTRLTDEEKLANVHDLIKWLHKLAELNPSDPIIAGGDFNFDLSLESAPNSSEPLTFDNVVLPTFDAGRKKLDYVFSLYRQRSAIVSCTTYSCLPICCSCNSRMYSEPAMEELLQRTEAVRGCACDGGTRGVDPDESSDHDPVICEVHWTSARRRLSFE